MHDIKKNNVKKTTNKNRKSPLTDKQFKFQNIGRHEKDHISRFLHNNNFLTSKYKVNYCAIKQVYNH